MTIRESAPRQPHPSHTRCAVYTRKSSEEGLDQAFNSLDAQREAGVDYIKSQKHQGWTLVPTMYDDGGYSGGSTERPGLQLLLEDIKRGRIDVVLVYKVDRLSRSLADFARLMQVFDENRVSFVSVTQQFNTTTSMGRLTLNMLLSFAQFEREVAGERIRDKIAATKRKGVWVCGRPPLGYRLPRQGEDGVAPGDRTLRIIEPEAKLVRLIYDEYLALGSPLGVAMKLNAAGYSPRRSAGSTADRTGGFTSPIIYKVLTNPIYIGKVTHTLRSGERGPSRQPEPVTEVYDAAHTPIIALDIWERVRARMDRDSAKVAHRWSHTHLLKGKVQTLEGHAMSPTSVQRPMPGESAASNNGDQRKGSKRLVRYYISQKALRRGYKSCPIKSINAEQLDNLVRAVVMDHLRGTHSIDLRLLEASTRDHWIREVVQRVVLAPELLTVEINTERTAACGEEHGRGGKGGLGAADAGVGSPTCPFAVDVEARDRITLLKLRMQIRRHDGRRLLLSPDGHDLFTTVRADGAGIPREHLVRAVATAFAWRAELLKTGDTLTALGQRYGCTTSWVRQMVSLTNLAPDIIGKVLSGALSGRVSLDDLRSAAEHLDWDLQRHMLRQGDRIGDAAASTLRAYPAGADS